MNTASKSYRLWVACLLFLGTFVGSMDRSSIGVAVPAIMKDLHLDPAMMGIVLSSFFWSYFLMNMPGGVLADKYGPKLVLGWSFFVWSFLTALCGTARNFFQLILCRLGVGAGEGALQPCNVKVVTSYFPTEERATVIGIFNAGIRLGLAVVPVLMTFLMTARNWRFAFYVTGTASLIWLVLWYFTFKEAKPETQPTGLSAERIPWQHLIRHRTIFGVVLCKFFQDYLYNMFITWLPAYLVMERGFTILKMGWYASVPWIVTFLALPAIGLLSDVLIKRGMSVTASRKGVIIVGQLLASVVVIAVYAESAMLAICLLTVALATEAGASTVLYSVVPEVAPPNATAAVAGMMTAAGALSGIVAPVVTGVLLKLTGGFRPAFVAASFMIVLAALTMGFMVGRIEQVRLKQHSGEREKVHA